MKTLERDPLDFDAWMELARHDPEAFARQRQQAIEHVLAQASPANRQRLRALQWRIDRECRRCTNPLAACIRVFNMMWERVYGKNGLLDCLQMLSPRPSAPAPRRPPANVLRFDAAPRRGGRPSARLDASRRAPSDLSS